MMFKTIEKDTNAEIVEKKSKFISNLYYVETIEQAEILIKQANKKYFDSRHNCFAFRIMTENGMMERFSDDGEPAGTAGSPMLNVLTSQNLCNVLIIVTRYFGGILLGTGGLVKAYTVALIEALKNTKVVSKELGEEVQFVINYADLEKMKYYFKKNNIKITNFQYGEKVLVTVEITPLKREQILQNKENFNLIEYKILKSKFITIPINAQHCE